ncbi:LytTR family DNA-binding domain-containing protein [Winogradskyella sp.]|jgi:DNA-binding LytR/AlgR family response regulator|uniref:LytR/AlgR family response regulator transcription factor n=1 Tax=Winogradskyella sp. TaxID=1883156 RepID=UPI0025EBA6F4|nr:LytTR family DNA-binding domain-containing protein [Winogradskyella sp.]MCT4630990.1 LytTR family DNA-binding domain-containing protein [Winogradskyella sp.]
MKRTCIIIEDQPPAQRILKKYIEDIGSLDLKATFSNAISAISFLQENTIGIIFLDIHLPKISGIDFLKTLQQSPQIILTTAFSEYALESYDYNVVDYLLKPFSFQRFIQAVTKANTASISKVEVMPKPLPLNKEFFIKSGHDLVKIDSDSILYITSVDKYCEVYTIDKMHLSSDTLKQWEERLDDMQFYKVHKSFVVNVSKISKISGNQVLIDDYNIPIGRVYKEAFISKIKSLNN